MKKTNKFSPEVRERAVRMVQEHRGEYPSLWAAIEPIAPKIGCVPQTLNEWVKRAEVDAGVREGVTTSEAQRVKELEREAMPAGPGQPAVLCRATEPVVGERLHLCLDLAGLAVRGLRR